MNCHLPAALSDQSGQIEMERLTEQNPRVEFGRVHSVRYECRGEFAPNVVDAASLEIFCVAHADVPSAASSAA